MAKLLLIFALPVAVLALAGWYAQLLARFGRAWANLAAPPEPAGVGLAPLPVSFSVVVAARNEAARLPALLADLAAQHYPAGAVEILVADDYSTDATAAVVRAFAATAPVPVRLVSLAANPAAGQGKKAALAAAIRQTRHPWLAFTDADCRLGPHWLAAFASALHRQPTLDLLSGPVVLQPDGSVFARLQVVEFAGLIGVGAASLALGRPTMCNGANLVYRRAAWEAVGGFATSRHVASGDDEFLMHALWARRPGSAAFLKSPAAVVRTAAAPGVVAFLRQRVRWASKWRHYRQPAAQRLGAAVFLLNLGLLLGLGWAWAWPVVAPWVGGAWLVKLVADGLFLGQVLAFFGERRRLALSVLAWQVVYVPYVLGTALRALSGTYEWKNRAIRPEKPPATVVD